MRTIVLLMAVLLGLASLLVASPAPAAGDIAAAQGMLILLPGAGLQERR